MAVTQGQPGQSAGGVRSQSVTTNPWAAVYFITQRTDASGEIVASNIYNVTKLCITAQMQLIENGTSGFSVTLANPGGRILGLFQPMDRVIVIGGRNPSERQQMFTGFITKVPPSTYRRGDPISIACNDVLYQLNRIYIDPFVSGSWETWIQNSLPDEILYTLLTDINMGAFLPEDVFVAKLPVALEQRWLQVAERQGSNAATTPGGGGAGGSSGPLSGGSNPEKIFNYVLGKGLDCKAAGAVVGNLLRI